MNTTTNIMRNPTTPTSVSSNKLDPIAVLREELAAAALCHGVERVEDLTEALVSRVVQRLGGGYVYVATQQGLKKKQMAQQIREQFNGFNTRQLAKQHGISMRQVQRILLVTQRTNR